MLNMLMYVLFENEHVGVQVFWLTNKHPGFSWWRKYEPRDLSPRLEFHTALSQMNEGIAISSNQPQWRNSKLSVAASFELLLSTWQDDLQPEPSQIKCLLPFKSRGTIVAIAVAKR